MIFHAQVDVTFFELGIGFARAYHQESRRLHSAFITPGGLSRLQRRDQPFAKLALRFAVGARHLRDDFGPGEDVSLAGESVANLAARPVQRALARMAYRAPAKVYNPHLTALP